MNIQISVAIWTVISLCAMMLVLDRLLFKPVLKVMDARREKIDRAKAEKSAALKAREDEIRALTADDDSAERAAEQLRLREEELKAEEVAIKLANAQRLEADKAGLSRDAEKYLEDSGKLVDELALAYAEKMAV